MVNLNENAKNQIDKLINAAYKRAADKGLLPTVESLSGTVEQPRDSSHGDYACTYAMSAAKAMRMPPRKIAETLMSELELEGSFFDGAEVAGSGFINFRVSGNWYDEVLKGIESEGENYGGADMGRGEKVMVEFVSANPTGTMTIGNARGGVLGDVLASVLERAGYDVHREFYVNDAGNQVELFGKSLEARYIQLIKGEEAVEFPENGYHGDDIKELAKKFYDIHGDKYLDVPGEERAETMRVFGIEANIEKMRVDLENYGIKYDCWFRESSIHDSGYVDDTVKLLVDGGLTYEKDGALWLSLTGAGAEKDEVLRRSNGFYTYFAVDIAYHRNKFSRGFDRVIDVLGTDHHGHALRFKAAIAAVGQAIGIENRRLDFALYQLVRLIRDGETVKVSKRTGKAITLADLLDEIPRDAARFFFNAKPDTHLEFDMGLAIRQDSENPVYYVQYAHARICSLISSMAESLPGSADEIDISLINTEQEKELIRQLARMPDEILLSARDYDPSRINRYVTELAASFHRFYSACRIRGEEPELLRARLCLADKTKSVIANCLKILGVSAPEKM